MGKIRLRVLEVEDMLISCTSYADVKLKRVAANNCPSSMVGLNGKLPEE